MPTRMVALLLLVPLAGGCEQARTESATIVHAAQLGDLFAADTIILQEAPDDSIADIGVLAELDNGTIAMGDRFQARIRLYSSRGALLRSGGRYGSGANEFRSITGITAKADTLYITDAGNGRIQVLDSSLHVVRTLRSEAHPIGDVFVTAAGLLLESINGRFGDRLSTVDLDGSIIWGAFPVAGAVADEPYWRSFSTVHIAPFDDRIVVSDGLLYPLAIFDTEGNSLGHIGTPPPSYQQITSVGLGAFAGRQTTEVLQQWYDQFTTIGGLFRVGDDNLVVVNSRLTATPTELMRVDAYSLDIYSASSGRKLAEEVALPPGARVLAGGQHLYVLTSQAPESWTILRLSPKPATLAARSDA